MIPHGKLATTEDLWVPLPKVTVTLDRPGAKTSTTRPSTDCLNSTFHKGDALHVPWQLPSASLADTQNQLRTAHLDPRRETRVGSRWFKADDFNRGVWGRLPLDGDRLPELVFHRFDKESEPTSNIIVGGRSFPFRLLNHDPILAY